MKELLEFQINCNCSNLIYKSLIFFQIDYNKNIEIKNNTGEIKMNLEEKYVEHNSKYYIMPHADDEIWHLLQQALPESNNYESIANAKFMIVIVDPIINKKTIARIRTAGPHVKLFDDYDFIIEISNEHYIKFDNEVKKIILEHELCHAVGEFNTAGEVKYKIVDHDIKDFHNVVKKYGVDWLESLKEIAIESEVERRQDKNPKEDSKKSEQKAQEEIDSIKL